MNMNFIRKKTSPKAGSCDDTWFHEDYQSLPNDVQLINSFEGASTSSISSSADANRGDHNANRHNATLGQIHRPGNSAKVHSVNCSGNQVARDSHSQAMTCFRFIVNKNATPFKDKNSKIDTAQP